MRVISGTFKGRRITAPAGMATRPTADRIKESMFNILAGSVRNKRVLDLFAGTGALGIEALSRGATLAVFVDYAKAALAAIHHNIRELGLEGCTRVVRWNILKNLNCLKPERNGFDLVFMDPPYETNSVLPALEALLSCGALSADARLIIEHSNRESIVRPMDKLIIADQRRFGKTLVSFLDTML